MGDISVLNWHSEPASHLRGLAAQRFFPTIDFRLRYISVLHQRRNACVRQFVAVLAHAIFQTFGFEPPLMAKISIIICTVLHVFVGCLRRADTTNEEQGRISSIYHLGVYENVSDALPPGVIHVPLYSRKLHILVRLPSTSCVTSLTILPFALGAMVVNHFASLTLPVKLASILHRHRLVKVKMTLT